MGIKFFQKTVTIPYADGNGEIEVRGLTLPEITKVVEVHKADAVMLFDKFTGRDPDSLTIDDAATVASELLTKFPGMVAHAVALGADAEDQFDDVIRLPPDVLITALEQVAILTFQMSGGFQNFLQLVLRLATNANGATQELKNLRPSTNGSKASGGK